MTVAYCSDGLVQPPTAPRFGHLCYQPGDLEETKSEKASDEKYAKDLKATCAKKANAFDERQKLRKEDRENLESVFWLLLLLLSLLGF